MIEERLISTHELNGPRDAKAKRWKCLNVELDLGEDN